MKKVESQIQNSTSGSTSLNISSNDNQATNARGSFECLSHHPLFHRKVGSLILKVASFLASHHPLMRTLNGYIKYIPF